MSLSAGVCCRLGKRRTNNEDNFFLNGSIKSSSESDVFLEHSPEKPLPSGVYAVCDGMGGQAHGELASWVAAYSLSKFQEPFLDLKLSPQEQADQYVKAANRSIVRIARQLQCHMGATLALAVIREDGFHLFNLGDSRIYLRSGDTLTQLSKDHTKTQSLLDMGIVPKKTGHTEKDGALVQYLGIPTDEMLLEPHYAAGTLCPGDRLLLCSDGLTDMLTDAEIASMLSDDTPPAQQAQRLAMTAEEAGGKDNITALVIGLTP